MKFNIKSISAAIVGFSGLLAGFHFNITAEQFAALSAAITAVLAAINPAHKADEGTQ